MPAPTKPFAFLDLDGPILEVSPRHYQVYADIAAGLGGRAIGAGEFWEAKRSKTPDSEILRASGIVARDEDYRRSKIREIENSRYLALDRLQPGAVPALERLSAAYQLVLVTLRQSPEALANQLSALGVARQFDFVLSGPAGERKGWETKVALVLGAGIAPDQRGFFAGDTETDILAGKALGVSTVAVCNGIRNESFLRALSPDWIVPTLSDLASTPLLP